MAGRRNFLARIPLAPVIALMLGTAVAVVIATMPQDALQTLVSATGIDSIVAAARPPLGLKARLIALFLGFAVVTALVWAVVAVIERLLSGQPLMPLKMSAESDELDLTEFVTADVAAPRRPIFADRELGAPLMSDAALTTAAPLELDDFDLLLPPSVAPEVAVDEMTVAPFATPQRQTTPVEAPFAALPEDVLAEPLAAEEFALEPDSAPDASESSIDALIRRLEASLARRGPPVPPDPSRAPPVQVSPRESGWLVRSIDAAAENGSDASRALRTLRQMAR